MGTNGPLFTKMHIIMQGHVTSDKGKKYLAKKRGSNNHYTRA